jgi:hypothetical protein
MIDNVSTSSESARMSSVGSTTDDKAQKAAADGRNAIFAELVQAEDDTVGLLAYGLYKQNKRDWLISLAKEHGREVTPGELQAYHLGERTPRRLLTYRRLAVDVLSRDPGGREGEGLAATYAGGVSGPSGGKAGPPSLAQAILARGWSTALIAALAVIGVIAVVILALTLFSPGVMREILPAPATSAPAAPSK